MAYLLLLALVYSFAIGLLFFQSAVQNKSAALVSFGLGFSLLAIGYAAQVMLSFDLNEGAARIFYWARVVLVLAWFGHALLLSVFPGHKLVGWVNRGLVFASFSALGLVAFTQITNAENWFQPAGTIYSQIGDLLATNRPTRWLAVLLQIYGFVALVGGSIYLLRNNRSIFGQALLTIFGALILAIPLYWAESQPSPAFYVLELITPVILFISTLSFLRFDPQARKTKSRRTAA